MRQGNFEHCVCTLCGAVPPLPVSIMPTKRMEDAKAQGFEWLMVQSGENPIYQWHCGSCRDVRGWPNRTPIRCTHPADRVVALLGGKVGYTSGVQHDSDWIPCDVEWCRVCGAQRTTRRWPSGHADKSEWTTPEREGGQR